MRSRPTRMTPWKAAEAATASVRTVQGKADGAPVVEKSDLEGEVTRRVRSDGAGHRLLEKQRSCRWIVRGVIPASLSPMRDEASSDDNKKSTNATYGAGTFH